MGKSLTKKSLIMIMAFMISLSSVAILAGNSSAQVTTVGAGNYTMSYDPATSTIYNINYTNPNYTILTASQVVTSGMNSTVAPQAYCDVNKVATLTNVSIYTTDDNDMLLLSTTLPGLRAGRPYYCLTGFVPPGNLGSGLPWHLHHLGVPEEIWQLLKLPLSWPETRPRLFSY